MRIDTAKWKEFKIGEHILTIPLKFDPRKQNTQYQIIEGYSIIGVDVSGYSSSTDSNIYGGGSVLYVNNQVVQCKLVSYDINGKGIYNTFGIPVESELNKGKTLK